MDLPSKCLLPSSVIFMKSLQVNKALPGWLSCRIEPVELFFRILLGGVFCVAGAGKIGNLLIFESTIRNYRILEDPWIAWTAMVLPPFEVIGGTLVILRLLYPGCLILLCGALLAFMGALVSLLARGIDTQCGCLGLVTTIQVQLMIDCGLVASAVILLWMWRKGCEQSG